MKNMRHAKEFCQNQLAQQFPREKLLGNSFSSYQFNCKKDEAIDSNVFAKYQTNDKNLQNCDNFEKTNCLSSSMRSNQLDFVLSNLAAIAGAYQNSFSSSKPNPAILSDSQQSFSLFNEKKFKNN